MYTVADVLNVCEQAAPTKLAESYDNVGLLVGSKKDKVTKILCALDLNEEVVQEAISEGADCIITHHPFIFKAIKRIDTQSPQGRVLKQLMVHEISLIAMHTNLDIAKGGINDYLAAQLGLKDIQPLKVLSTNEDGSVNALGRIGKVEKQPLSMWVHEVKQIFKVPFVRVVAREEKEIEHVAVCGGSGESFLFNAIGVCDVYVTGDLTFHMAQEALKMGLILIDVGHYASENIAVSLIKDIIANKISDIEVLCSQVDGEVFKVY